MSREELLEHHIYVPNVVDDRIKAHLLMGDSVLVWARMNHSAKSLRKVMLGNISQPKLNFMQFCLCIDEDLEDVCEYKNDIVSTNYVLWDLFLSRENVENIKDMFYD